MKLTDANLEKKHLASSHYGFSATRIADLGAAKYTLVQMVVDVSGSTKEFRTAMEDCIKSVVQSCKYSPQADNLMLRLNAFDDNVIEVHGYKLLETCNQDDYTNSLQQPGMDGMTALHDACINGIGATSAYGADLIKNDFEVNGLVCIITDGCDNRSVESAGAVKAALADIAKKESMESCISILVKVNIADPFAAQQLKDFENAVGFTQVIDLGDVNAKKFAKLADFVSKSISSQSKSLGSGGPSQLLTI